MPLGVLLYLHYSYTLVIHRDKELHLVRLCDCGLLSKEALQWESVRWAPRELASAVPSVRECGSITLQDRLMSGVMLEEAESTEAVLSLYKRCAQMTHRNGVHFSVLAL